MCDPLDIGDKARWFSQHLQSVKYQVCDPSFRLFSLPWEEGDSEVGIFFNEDEDANNAIEDDDNSSCYSSISDLVEEMVNGDISGEPSVIAPPYSPLRASSPLPEAAPGFTFSDPFVPPASAYAEIGKPLMPESGIFAGDDPL